MVAKVKNTSTKKPAAKKAAPNRVHLSAAEIERRRKLSTKAAKKIWPDRDLARRKAAKAKTKEKPLAKKAPEEMFVFEVSPAAQAQIARDVLNPPAPTDALRRMYAHAQAALD